MDSRVTQGQAIAATARLVEPPSADDRGDPLSHPACEEIELAAVLHALSDPMRLRIVTGRSKLLQVRLSSTARPTTIRSRIGSLRA